MPPNAARSLEIAKQHLEKVQHAWDDPTDWADLSIYGFYCLEAAVMAAVAHLGRSVKRTHPDKVNAAAELYEKHGLPDIAELLHDLNVARKSEAYGDVEAPDLDPEDIATQIELYVDAVEKLLKK